MSVHKRPDRKNVYRLAWREPASQKILKKDFSRPNAKHDAEVFDQEVKLQKKKDPAKLISQEPAPDLNKIVSL